MAPSRTIRTEDDIRREVLEGAKHATRVAVGCSQGRVARGGHETAKPQAGKGVGLFDSPRLEMGRVNDRLVLYAIVTFTQPVPMQLVFGGQATEPAQGAWVIARME